MKRIFAVLGIVGLVGLYLLSFISAILAKPYAANLFMASIFCTMVIPIVIYGFLVIYRYVHRNEENSISLRDLKKQNKAYEKQTFQKKKNRKELDK